MGFRLGPGAHARGATVAPRPWMLIVGMVVGGALIWWLA